MHKSCDAQVKAAGTEDGLAEGQFRAVVSVFGNKDSYGDVVMPGAFADTLADWRASGDTIPVYWSHQMADPDYNIGWVVDAKETEAGLEVLAQLDTDPDASPKARQAYRLLKGRRVKQFSFAYDVIDGGPAEHNGESVYELRKLKLYEVGPTPVGANPETELLAVKNAAQRAQALTETVTPELLSVTDDSPLRDTLASLEAAVTQLKNVLTTDAPAPVDEPRQEQANESAPVKAEEPARVKAEEPNRLPSVMTWATAIDLMTLEGETL